MYFAPIDWIYDPVYLVVSAVLIASLTTERGGVYQLMRFVPYKISKYSTSVYFVHALVISVGTNVWGGRPDSIADLFAVLVAAAVCAVLFEMLTDRVRRWISEKIN